MDLGNRLTSAAGAGRRVANGAKGFGFTRLRQLATEHLIGARG